MLLAAPKIVSFFTAGSWEKDESSEYEYSIKKNLAYYFEPKRFKIHKLNWTCLILINPGWSCFRYFISDDIDAPREYSIKKSSLLFWT